MERKKRAMTYKTSKASGEILEKIKSEIDHRGGIVKTEHLDAMGIDYRRVLDFVESGELIRIKNGYYTDRIDRFTETELVAKLFPDGLLCMESALYAYGYLSEKPYGWRIAVDKNTSKSRFVMDYPKVIPYYTEPEALQIGASEIELDGVRFGIYDKERTICDCLKYESKMERSSFQAAIQAYIREEDKDISLLLEYARARKVIKKVQSMIGVWL
jgi:predicted transcriptional regulator of viral defense system